MPELPTITNINNYIKHLPNVDPQWWGAVAGAAVAGAILVPAHRIVAGAVAGLALLALALYKTPCCAGCAAGAGCAGATVAGITTTTSASPQLGAMDPSSGPAARDGDLFPGVDIGQLLNDAETVRTSGRHCS